MNCCTKIFSCCFRSPTRDDEDIPLVPQNRNTPVSNHPITSKIVSPKDKNLPQIHVSNVNALVQEIKDGETVVVSATIALPELCKDEPNHLYYGIEQIKMLNVMLPSSEEELIDSQTLIKDVIKSMTDKNVGVQIEDFIKR